MTNLKDRIRHTGRILARASLIGAVGLAALFGIDYCGQQCNNNIPNIDESIQELYSPKPFMFNSNKYEQLKKKNKYEVELLRQRNEYEAEMSKERVKHQIAEIKTHELELRNKRYNRN